MGRKRKLNRNKTLQVSSVASAHDGSRAGLGWTLKCWWMRRFSDKELVQRARAGDPGAFDALAARYRDRLQKLVQTPASGDREMVARRKSILAAFRDIDSFGVNCCPGTWLYLKGIQAAFATLDVPADPYPFEGSSEAATDLPSSPRAA